MITSQYDCLLKIVLVGDAKIGKTSLFNAFLSNTDTYDYLPTMGVDFGFKKVRIEDTLIKIALWDTAGIEHYRSITHNYYKGSDIIILLYDITNIQSFNNINIWLYNINKYIDDTIPYIIALVGTKFDLNKKRQVSEIDAANYAKANNMYFMEVSSMTKKGIDKLFYDICKEVYPHKMNNITDNDIHINEVLLGTKKKSCCKLM
jgi:Ras-related protein Rab-1A